MTKNNITRTTGWAGALALGLFAQNSHAATITQTVNDGGAGWNGSLWGSPAAAPTAGNDYVTASGLTTSSSTLLGTPGVTGRIRLISGQTTFGGDSLTVAANTEILGKDAGTYTADIILNGGIIRWSPNSGGVNGTLAGTLAIAADSVLGSVQSGANSFTIASTLTGSSTLRLATGTGTAQTLTFDDGAGTSLNGFAGTLDIGGGNSRAIVDFNQAYLMSLAGITMGDYSTADILNLDADLTVASFAFGGTGLTAGTYSIGDLNSTFGSGTQFTGTGNLIIVPEPETALLGGLGLLGLLRRRRV